MRLLIPLAALIPAAAAATPVELAHQARLLDASGGPLQGLVDLEVALYPSEAATDPSWSLALPGTSVQDGYVSVVLPLDTDDLAGGALWVGWRADGVALAPRQPLAWVPRAARAAVAERLPLGPAPTGACDDVGAVVFDPTSGTLTACALGGWVPLGGQPDLRADGAVRSWSDGSFARTCEAYRRPEFPYRYAGDTGDGLYRIDPDGDGTPTTAWCDMSTDDGGWTLCFAYDTASYDSANWPSVSGSRNKLLAQTWGSSALHGNGSTQGNFCNQMPVQANNTLLRAEVVRTQTSASLWSATFTLREASFFTQVHSAGSLAFDCLISNDGGSRLIYANYSTPSRAWNGPLLDACSGSAGQHLDRTASNTSNNGIDAALIFAGNSSGRSETQELSLQVNWYADFTTSTLYTSTGSVAQAKFGVTSTWSNGNGRPGSSTQYPGPNYCYTYCGHTNRTTPDFKQRLWVR